MLDILHRLGQEVTAAKELSKALELITSGVKKAIHVDVCSIYLTDFSSREHVLAATDGLRDDAVGKVRLPMYRGLVGLVCERAEPVNVADATQHPRYHFITETGETRYAGFLGVPIIHYRKVLGVLVVRQIDPRRFDEEEVTFLFTLAAQLAGAISHAVVSGELSLSDKSKTSRHYLSGQSGSSGIALGEAFVTYQVTDLDTIPERLITDIDKEKIAFSSAVTRVERELADLKKRLSSMLASEDQALFDALLMMLGGDTLVSRTLELIERNCFWAPGALRQSINEHAQVFEALEDPYMRERASDIRDLGRRILMHLRPAEGGDKVYPDRTILVGDEVSAMQLADVPKNKLKGIVSAKGSGSSHIAILARAMGIPALMGVVDMPSARVHGSSLIIDGYRGRVYIDPAASVCIEYQRLADEDLALSEELDIYCGVDAETTDGYKIPLMLNTGLVAALDSQGIEEADGVGLFRTELPFMIRDRFPSEDVQTLNYHQVLNAFSPRPVTLRMLDIGGDKPLPYFPIKESNPFLGWRGIRILLDHPEIFMTQVRAMLRASVGYQNLRIMLPMITHLSQVDEALSMIYRAHEELIEEGYEIAMPQTGVMVETPAAVYMAGELARRVDFLSVGSNDLTQYLLAVDRNNSYVADLFEDLHPAVLRALKQVVDLAKENNTNVSLCGEMASNPAAVPLLFAMGFDSLSMSSGSLLRVKAVIRAFSTYRAKELLRNALICTDAASVRRLMEQALDAAGLGGLVRAGR